MQTFWNMLERKRQQLEMEGEQTMGPVGQETLSESIGLIQLELRDLMSQVSSQVATTFTETILKRLIKGSDTQEGWRHSFCFVPQISHIQSSWMEPPPPTVAEPQCPHASSERDWDSRVEGYVILRDLDLYLIRLARDFLLLATQSDTSQHWAKREVLKTRQGRQTSWIRQKKTENRSIRT